MLFQIKEPAMAAQAHGSDSYRRHLVRISRTSPGFTAASMPSVVVQAPSSGGAFCSGAAFEIRVADRLLP